MYLHYEKKTAPPKKTKKSLITMMRNFVGVHNEDTVGINETPALLMKEFFFYFRDYLMPGTKVSMFYDDFYINLYGLIESLHKVPVYKKTILQLYFVEPIEAVLSY